MKDYFIKTAEKGDPFQDAFIFDCHGHLGSCTDFYIPGASPENLLKALDRVGINVAAVSSFSGVQPFGNDIVGQTVSSFPDRFVGYARVNANYPITIKKELERCFNRLGFKGIKIHPYCDQVFPDDPRYEPVWKFAHEHSTPVLIHTWNNLRNNDPLLRFCTPSLFEKIARDYPEARIILGHSGGEYDGILEAIKLAKDIPNVYLDTASSRLYPGIVKMIVNEAGVEKVLYGSDIPFLSPIPQIGKIIYADLEEHEKRKILGLNAAKLFNIQNSATNT
jgi:predicted TIM-barrel fold metal-dependent hydrolase